MSANYVKVFRIKSGDGSEKLIELPMQLDVDRPKRPRTTFQPHQLEALETAFRTNGYLSGERRSRLAETLKLSDTQVKVWFQNRRTKGRKQSGDEGKVERSEEKREKEEDRQDTSMSTSHILSNRSHLQYLPLLLPPMMTNDHFSLFDCLQFAWPSTMNYSMLAQDPSFLGNK